MVLRSISLRALKYEQYTQKVNTWDMVFVSAYYMWLIGLARIM